MRRSLESNRSRLWFVKGLFALLFLVVAGRAFQLQMLQGEKLKTLGEKQHFFQEKLGDAAVRLAAHVATLDVAS